jgi:hypothetical protein
MCRGEDFRKLYRKRRIFSQSTEALDFLLFLFFGQAKKRKVSRITYKLIFVPEALMQEN